MGERSELAGDKQAYDKVRTEVDASLRLHKKNEKQG